MTEISIHVKDKHTCGHMHETIFHMKEASIDGYMESPCVKFEPLRNLTVIDWKHFKTQVEPGLEHTLALSGNVDRTEVRMCGCGWIKPKKLGLWRRFNAWIARDKDE